MTPQNEAEREAVRQALKAARKQKADNSSGADKARVTVNLPAEARLFVDNVLVPYTTPTRAFDTPSLQPNQNYIYTLRAEVERDGQKLTQTQRVQFTAGQQVNVRFDNFTDARTAQR